MARPATVPGPVVLVGRGVSAGIARAPLARIGRAPVTAPSDPRGADPEHECARLREALAAVAAGYADRAAAADPVATAVLEATADMAADPALAERAAAHVRAGTPTGHAVTLAVGEFGAQFAALGGLFAERATDLVDIGNRVVCHLAGVAPPGVPAPGHPIVLVAADLAPADTAALGGDVVAFVTERGGPTSHTAILARALGLPAVVGCAGVTGLDDGIVLEVDGAAGTVTVDPEPSPEPVPVRTDPRPAPDGPGRTADGVPIALLTNIGTVADARAAAAGPSEGVGLFRTEFVYLDRAAAPTRAEQRATYTEVLRAFGDRRVVVRTLDAGSDKPLRFLPHGDAEANPALGVRGLRTALAHPDLLDDQLAALAAAAEEAGRPVDVMAPMVATVDEAAWFAERARRAGLTRVGVMIEVPAAALRARELFEVVDFVSVGTNDLGQYVMAADRQSAELGELTDPWQPALLDLVAMVGRAGRAADRPVGVCGEAAADPLLAAVLVGLDVTSLSTAASARAAVRTELAGHTLAACRELAVLARAAPSAAAARAAVHAARRA